MRGCCATIEWGSISLRQLAICRQPSVFIIAKLLRDAFQMALTTTLKATSRVELSGRRHSLPTRPCQACERNGLSGFDILWGGLQTTTSLATREYKIEIDCAFDSSRTVEITDCPLCRLILSRLPQHRLFESQFGRATSNLILREFSRTPLPGTTTQETRISIFSNDRSCGSLRKVLPTCQISYINI
jgi:hypothetical protein